jgi:hypothetical protein
MTPMDLEMPAVRMGRNHTRLAKNGLQVIVLLGVAIVAVESCSPQVVGTEAKQSDIEILDSALESLSHWWIGKTHNGVKTWFNEDGQGKSDEFWTVEVSSEGDWIRQVRKLSTRTGSKEADIVIERVEIPGQRMVARDQRFGLSPGIRFLVNGEFTRVHSQRFLPEFHPDLIWAGYSNTDGMYFFQLLKLPGCKVLVADCQFDDHSAKRFSFDVKGYGEYEFVVSGTPPLVRSAEVRKNRVYEIYVRDFFDSGDTAPVARKGDGLRQVAHRIDYTELNGQWIPAKLDLEFFYTEEGVANSPHWRLQIDISNVKPFEIGDTTRAVFTELPVKDGTPIDVKEKAGLAYEFRDGRISRVVEHSSVAEMDGVRFRKPLPRPVNWYLWGSVTAGLALIGVLAWRRRSSGG